jgi:hypothetical protein
MARTAVRKPPLDLRRDTAPDRIAERKPEAERRRWNLVLTWFMRTLALVWVMKGLGAWAVILGVWSPVGPFEVQSGGYQATIIYFALIDIVAAVGLWMASSWGGVLWLVAVMSHLILDFFFPRFIPGNLITGGVFIGLIGAYLVASWLAAHEE